MPKGRRKLTLKSFTDCILNSALLLVSIAKSRLEARRVARVCFMESYASSSNLDGIFRGTATDGIAAACVFRLGFRLWGREISRWVQERGCARGTWNSARRGCPRPERCGAAETEKGMRWRCVGACSRCQGYGSFQCRRMDSVGRCSTLALAPRRASLTVMFATSTTSACIARPNARAPVTARRSARAAASPVGSRAAKIRGTSAFAASRIGVVVRAGEEQKAGATTADDDEMPPWERRELMKKAAMEKGGLPWPAYLGLSVIVSIAAIGSCFELNYGNPIFGIVGPDSFLYKPILYWFIGTGFPLAAFLWTKGIAGANEAAELQDELDGY